MIGRGGREGRDRFPRDYNSRSEEKSQYGRNSNPPSRHLWVGNLSHHISESILSEHFLRFGELESIAFQPGRSYAFVNFRKDEDALIAVRALQGFVLAGFPLKIEFAKASMRKYKLLMLAGMVDHMIDVSPRFNSEPNTSSKAKSRITAADHTLQTCTTEIQFNANSIVHLLPVPNKES